MEDKISLEMAADGEGRSLVSVVVGRRFAVAPDGLLSDRGDFAFCEEPIEYEATDCLGPIQPDLMKRDIDTWPWKSGADLVIQGTANFQSPIQTTDLLLEVRGEANFRQVIRATGDRRVERRGGQLALSDPERFDAMPLRWDKAYGGTDAAAHERMLHPDYLWLIRQQMSEEAADSWSELSYPRNPAGKGYLVEGSDPEGLQWPNLEFAGEELSLTRLQLPVGRWGQQVYPACWDWLPYFWVPRLCALGDHPETFDEKSPSKEVELGILTPDFPSLGLIQRNMTNLARGAHPYLQHLKFSGDEVIRVSALGHEGADLTAQLPGLCPQVELRLGGGRVQTLRGELDLVFIEGDEQSVSLVWRASTYELPNPLGVDFSATAEVPLPPGWQEQAEVSVAWV